MHKSRKIFRFFCMLGTCASFFFCYFAVDAYFEDTCILIQIKHAIQLKPSQQRAEGSVISDIREMELNKKPSEVNRYVLCFSLCWQGEGTNIPRRPYLSRIIIFLSFFSQYNTRLLIVVLFQMCFVPHEKYIPLKTVSYFQLQTFRLGNINTILSGNFSPWKQGNYSFEIRSPILKNDPLQSVLIEMFIQ